MQAGAQPIDSIVFQTQDGIGVIPVSVIAARVPSFDLDTFVNCVNVGIAVAVFPVPGQSHQVLLQHYISSLFEQGLYLTYPCYRQGFFVPSTHRVVAVLSFLM